MGKGRKSELSLTYLEVILNDAIYSLIFLQGFGQIGSSFKEHQ